MGRPRALQAPATRDEAAFSGDCKDGGVGGDGMGPPHPSTSNKRRSSIQGTARMGVWAVVVRGLHTQARAHSEHRKPRQRPQRLRCGGSAPAIGKYATFVRLRQRLVKAADVGPRRLALGGTSAQQRRRQRSQDHTQCAHALGLASQVPKASGRWTIRDGPPAGNEAALRECH
eukprot:364298-Chlamydomonas_euryale.AAC.7